MINTDYHMHTTFCDGKNTAEEMVLSAIGLGLKQIGFSGHSHTFFDPSYAMTKEGTAAYQAEIMRLKEKYQDKISILLGVEQDYYSEMSTTEYDYVIGSVHYLKFGNQYVPMDEGNENLKNAATAFCGGDMLSLLERYYETVSDVVRKTGCNIIGHFDLPTKYFEKETLADLRSDRYRAAWKKAADSLLKTDAVFELNTGAISRGCKKEQYPSDEILAYLGEKKARIILSSDSHRIDTLCFEFPRMEEKCRKYGLQIVNSPFVKGSDLS